MSRDITVEKVDKRVERIVYDSETVYKFELNHEQASALLAIVSRINGSPKGTVREVVATPLYEALTKAGLSYATGRAGEFGKNITHSMSVNGGIRI